VAVTTGPSFRFRLERIRALRERREDLAKQQLARAVSRLSSSQGRLDAVEDRLERVRAYQRLAAGEATTVSAGELLAQQALVEHVEAQRTIGVDELERNEAEVADRGAEFGHAAREHQMLERLKERQRGEHERETTRRENNLLDELAMDRSRRSVA
jgi:flagellar export protein FliJ